MKVKSDMQIGDLAAATGVSRRLLRYYEEQELLRPGRQANGYREYTEADIATVRHIRVLLAAGLPTTVIARLLSCVHDNSERIVANACPGVIDNLRRERGRIAGEIARLHSSQQILDALLASATQEAGAR